MRPFARFSATIAFILTLLGIFWVPKDLEDWEVAAEPWMRWLSMFDQTAALWAFSVAALIYILWMDARPFLKAYFDREAPLEIKPEHSAGAGSIGTRFISVTNTSSLDVENVSIYLKGIHHAGILRPALRPGAEGYLLFDGDKETVTLRPGEKAFAPYMKDIVVGGEEVEFGPFR